MAGDVNVFYHDDDDKTVGEMEVMIAEQDSRRKGLATEAVELMKKYVMQKFGTKHLIAKIKQHNHGSIKLFSERLGFQQTESNDFFNELYFEYPHPTATSSSKLYYEEKEKKEAERERTAEMERKKRLDDVVLPYLQSIITTTTTTTSSSSSSIASIASTSIIAPLTCKQSHSIKLSCLSDCFHKANTAVALLANQITALVTEPSLHNIEGKDDDGQGTRSEHEAEAKAGANANANAEATADRKIKTEKKKKVLERKIKTLTRIRNSKYAKLSKKLEGDQRLAQRCDCTHIHEYAIDSFITSKDPSVCNCVCSPDKNVEI